MRTEFEGPSAEDMAESMGATQLVPRVPTAGEAVVSLASLVHLAAALVHFSEFTEDGAPEDLMAARSAMSHPEVVRLLSELDAHALLPVRRDGVRYKQEGTT